jgi:hypothetical protein
MVVLPKGKFDGIRAHYNNQMDPDLGIGWAALCRVPCGCASCKEQLVSPWVPRVDQTEQQRYARKEGCSLWPCFEGANDWKICRLVPKSDDEEKGPRESLTCVLNALEARMSLMVREGDIGVVGTDDEAAMGYYLIRWLSEPYTLQEDTEGMSGIIDAGATVIDGLYYSRVQRAPYWYTPSETTTVFQVRHVLQTGLELQAISRTNKLPQTCNTAVATRQKAVMSTRLDHDGIMEEAMRHDVLEYNGNKEEEEESGNEDELKSNVESNSKDK